MRRQLQIRVLAAILLLILSSMVVSAEPQREFRGAWVTAWNNGFLTPAEADETVRLAKEANINALFIQVRKTGDAYYKSNFEPRATNILGGPDFDPLAYIIRKAHEQGVEVHAWINTFRIWSKSAPPSDPKHISVLHPDWITRTSTGDLKAAEGLFLDPGVQDVQDYTASVVMDIVKNYDVDGIHFDYIRYPGAEFGYAPPAVKRFNAEKGRIGNPSNTDPVWQQWRRDQVTALVDRVYKAATALKPNIKVTAATIPWGDCKESFCDTSPFRAVYQDWRVWLERGKIDAAIPMNYKDERNDKAARQYRNWLDGFARWKYGRQIYCGVDFNASPEMVVRQIKAARDRGIDGLVGFSFNQTPARLRLVQALKSGVYSQQSAVPQMLWKLPAMRRISRELYGRAVNAIAKGDVDQAIVLLTQSVELDPKSWDAHLRLARCYVKQSLWEDALREFDRVLEIDPNNQAAKMERPAAASHVRVTREGRNER